MQNGQDETVEFTQAAIRELNKRALQTYERYAIAKRGIYAILDKKAEDLLGQGQALSLHRHEATAVRMFDEAGRVEGSRLPKYPEDFTLVRIGWLTEETSELIADYKEILSGETWLAQAQAADKAKQEQENNR